LVALTFHGLPPERFVCNHKNADKLDNRASNLEWISVRANIQHAASLGLLRCGRLKGEENPNVKLTEEEVRQMRAQRLAGVTLAALGRQYGVTAQTAHLVTTGKTWRHLGGEGDADSAAADAISAVEVASPTNLAPREWLDLDGDELAMSL
jgi:hypothetical protein